ncbi:TPA: hypothetical protein U1D08_001030 [Streptococcus suis]|nr:hypothetical protein [Streptococcus suis]
MYFAFFQAQAETVPKTSLAFLFLGSGMNSPLDYSYPLTVLSHSTGLFVSPRLLAQLMDCARWEIKERSKSLLQNQAAEFKHSSGVFEVGNKETTFQTTTLLMIGGRLKTSTGAFSHRSNKSQLNDDKKRRPNGLLSKDSK